jgi:hypothetical protein
MTGGHYTAHCRNSIDNQWRHYDDECVSRVDAADVSNVVVANTAYLLFYEVGMYEVNYQLFVLFAASRQSSKSPSFSALVCNEYTATVHCRQKC